MNRRTLFRKSAALLLTAWVPRGLLLGPGGSGFLAPVGEGGHRPLFSERWLAECLGVPVEVVVALRRMRPDQFEVCAGVVTSLRKTHLERYPKHLVSLMRVVADAVVDLVVARGGGDTVAFRDTVVFRFRRTK